MSKMPRAFVSTFTSKLFKTTWIRAFNKLSSFTKTSRNVLSMAIPCITPRAILSTSGFSLNNYLKIYLTSVCFFIFSKISFVVTKFWSDPKIGTRTVSGTLPKDSNTNIFFTIDNFSKIFFFPSEIDNVYRIWARGTMGS